MRNKKFAASIGNEMIYGNLKRERRRSAATDEAKEIILKTMKEIFPGGTTHRRLVLELEGHKSLYMSEDKISKCAHLLVDDGLLKVVKMPGGRGRFWSLKK